MFISSKLLPMPVPSAMLKVWRCRFRGNFERRRCEDPDIELCRSTFRCKTVQYLQTDSLYVNSDQNSFK